MDFYPVEDLPGEKGERGSRGCTPGGGRAPPQVSVTSKGASKGEKGNGIFLT